MIPWPAKVLAAGVRDSAVHVVRPHGLTLEEVGYPADEALAARMFGGPERQDASGGGLLLTGLRRRARSSLAAKYRATAVDAVERNQPVMSGVHQA